jgi:hypothetical protein
MAIDKAFEAAVLVHRAKMNPLLMQLQKPMYFLFVNDGRPSTAPPSSASMPLLIVKKKSGSAFKKAEVVRTVKLEMVLDIRPPAVFCCGTVFRNSENKLLFLIAESKGVTNTKAINKCLVELKTKKLGAVSGAAFHLKNPEQAAPKVGTSAAKPVPDAATRKGDVQRTLRIWEGTLNTASDGLRALQKAVLTDPEVVQELRRTNQYVATFPLLQQNAASLSRRLDKYKDGLTELLRTAAASSDDALDGAIREVAEKIDAYLAKHATDADLEGLDETPFGKFNIYDVIGEGLNRMARVVEG